jgi:CRISPR system Cascade subunit CasE
MSLYLSRLTLDRSAGNAALASILEPGSPEQAMDIHHKLLWTVFGDHADRDRDFLWRSEGNGRFMVLSKRPPEQHQLFRPHETKEFSPALTSGDRLEFAMRVHATKKKDLPEMAKRANGKVGPKGIRVDVVMDRLHGMPKEERAERRMEVAREASLDWMTRQGEMNGFTISTSKDRLKLQGYSTPTLLRKGRKGANVGILELEGSLTVTDPEAFVARLGEGFGRAKAFGCGLMLVRRAQ